MYIILMHITLILIRIPLPLLHTYIKVLITARTFPVAIRRTP